MLCTVVAAAESQRLENAGCLAGHQTAGASGGGMVIRKLQLSCCKSQSLEISSAMPAQHVWFVGQIVV